VITRLNPANEVQAAIIAALKADSALTALVPAARIYPQQLPNPVTRPFIRFGMPIVTARFIDNAEGGDDARDGADVEAAIHCFVTASTAIPDPRAFSMTVASHIARVLNGLDATEIDDYAEMAVHVGQVQPMQEENADSWHSFVTFRAEV
jgi:hypothetical protein